MRRVGAFVAIVILLGTGCAKKAPTGAAAGAASPGPFTNQELVSELRRQGIGAAGAASAGGESLPEITETARSVIVTLPSTFFAFDRFELDAKAQVVVDRIAQVLNNPRAANRTLLLEGHTDNLGTTAYNLTLSRNRVDAVARELIKQGLRSDRISVEAHGETRPLAPNRKPDGSDDPAARAKNRRVEALIRN
ncbi:MAG: OmpA family protein [Candidatus Rokuibacteriota bacterium]